MSGDHKNYTIHISNAKYGHQGNGKEEECEPCYCGLTGIDSDGCMCLPKEEEDE